MMNLVCFNKNQCNVMVRLPLSLSIGLISLTRITDFESFVFQPCLVQSSPDSFMYY